MAIRSFTYDLGVFVSICQDNIQWWKTTAHRTRDALQRENVRIRLEIVLDLPFDLSDVDRRVAKRNYSSLVRASYMMSECMNISSVIDRISRMTNHRSADLSCKIKAGDEFNLLHRSTVHSLHTSSRSCSRMKHGWWNWLKSLTQTRRIRPAISSICLSPSLWSRAHERSLVRTTHLCRCHKRIKEISQLSTLLSAWSCRY